MFSSRKEDMVSPHSSILDTLPLSLMFDMEDVWKYEDPPDSNWMSYENPDQGYFKGEFAIYIPPNKPEVEAPIFNES